MSDVKKKTQREGKEQEANLSDAQLEEVAGGWANLFLEAQSVSKTAAGVPEKPRLTD